MKNIKYSSLFSQAFTLIADNLGFWLRSGLIVGGAIGLFAGLSIGFGFMVKVALQPLPIAIVAILGLLYFVLIAVVFSGFLKIYFNLVDGKEISVSLIFADISKALPFLVLSLLYMIIVALGFVALIIPGVIALVRFSWAFMIMVDTNCGVIESLRRSYKLTEGYFWEVATFCVMFAASMKIFFLTPIIALAYILMYRQVSDQSIGVDDTLIVESNITK